MVNIHLTESVYKVVLQKSIPTQIRQLILYISDDEGYVDEFVGELTFAKEDALLDLIVRQCLPRSENLRTTQQTDKSPKT